MGKMDSDRIFKIERNLSDAGCSASFIERFLKLEKDKNHREQQRLLSQHKLCLLKELHDEQYKIDCLDHMIYTMKKEDKD